MGKRRPDGLADQIDKKLHLTLIKYSELRNISISSLHSKYITANNAEILTNDGINIALAGIEISKSRKNVK